MRSGFVIAWRLATWPTSRSPSLVNATTDGVMRLPSSLTMTLGSRPSMIATHEFVVPRSIPMILPTVGILLKSLVFSQSVANGFNLTTCGGLSNADSCERGSEASLACS